MADKKNEEKKERGLWDILSDLDECILQLEDINVLLTTHDECVTDDLRPFIKEEAWGGDHFARRWSVHQATLNVIRRQLFEIAGGLEAAVAEVFDLLRASKTA